MLNTIRGVMHEGRIKLLEQVEIPEGTDVLVTPLTNESDYWLKAGETALATVWENAEDDVYAELLKK